MVGALTVEEVFVEELGEVCGDEAAVPVLHHVAAVHDLAKDVPQVLPRHLRAHAANAWVAATGTQAASGTQPHPKHG